jgi:hypothetical protein
MRIRLALAALLVALLFAIAPGSGASPNGELDVTAVTQTFSRGPESSSNRSITVFFHSAKSAPPGASGTLAVPENLRLEGPVDIAITNVETSSRPTPDTIAYWGSSEKIGPGQPRIRRGRAPDSHYSGGSTGMADPVRLASIGADGGCTGTYTAHISFIGTSSVTLTDEQDFLDPLIISSPHDGQTNFARPIVVSWNRVPRAAGYRVTATARAADGRIVLWENAWHSDAWRSWGVLWAVRRHLLMSADETTCIIPPGIFMGGPVLLRVTALSYQARGKGPMRVLGWAQSSTSMTLRGR